MANCQEILQKRRTVIVPCSVQNVKIIQYLINKWWTNETQQDVECLRWDLEDYPILQQSQPFWWGLSVSVQLMCANLTSINIFIRGLGILWSPVDCFAVGYPSEAYLKLKSHKNFFINKIYFSYPKVSKFCTEYSSITAVVCAKFQNHLKAEEQGQMRFCEISV